MSEIKVNSVVNSTGDNDSGLDLSTNDQVIIKTANTTAMTIDSSQNTTIAGDIKKTGDLTLDVSGDLIIDVDGNDVVFKNGGTTWLDISDDNGSDVHIESKVQDGDIYFRGNDGGSIINALYLDMSDGGTAKFNSSVLIGQTSGSAQLEVTATSAENVAEWRNYNNDGRGFAFQNSSNSTVGGITWNASSTSFNTSSDHRLKENVDYTFDATTRLKQLKPARFNFIADADTTVDGFLAHEVQSVVPEAISGTHNEVDDDGNAVMQGIDQSKLVPLLVKTIQELEARITALENA